MGDALWAIPPPFETKLPELRPSSMKRAGPGRSQRTPDLRVSYDGHHSMLMSTPAWDGTSGDGRTRLNRRKVPEMFPQKEGAWYPATKHKHTLAGCAPNGMRLFAPAPSLLLSKSKKKGRDSELKRTMQRLKGEISDFETANMSANGFDHGSSKSIAALTAAHGRMVADLREMQQVVEGRCASRWEPGLGRRRPRLANNGSRVVLDPISSPIPQGL